MARANFPLVSVPLSGVAIDYADINRAQRGYIADRVAPRRRVPSQLFRWYSGKIEEAFTIYDTQIDRLGQANEMTQGWTFQTDSTRDYAIRSVVPYRDQREAEAQGLPFDLRASAARAAVDEMQRNRELRVATLTMSASTYLAGYTRDIAQGWSNFDTSDPVRDVRDAQSKMLIRPNVAVTSRRVADILERHPKVAAALGGSLQSGQYNDLQRVARLFNLREIIVGDTLYQTSKRGQALTTGQIWSDSFAMHYRDAVAADGVTSLDSGEGARSPAFLTTFQWNDYMVSETEYDPGDMGLYGGVKVLAGESVLERSVAPYAGYLFQNVVAPAA